MNLSKTVQVSNLVQRLFQQVGNNCQLSLPVIIGSKISEPTLPAQRRRAKGTEVEHSLVEAVLGALLEEPGIFL